MSSWEFQLVNLYFSLMKRLDAYSFIIYCIFGFEGSSDLEPVSSVKTISVAFLWKAVSDELGRSKSSSVHYSSRSGQQTQYTSAADEDRRIFHCDMEDMWIVVPKVYLGVHASRQKNKLVSRRR
eukprot:scaffold2155_cov125-Skeletonema_dohrnii-CCMP3373.AAC.3